MSGVRVGYQKVIAFALSGALGAVGGVLYMHAVTFISPTDVGVDLSILLVLTVIIGGAYRLVGAVVGAVFVLGVPDLMRSVQPYQGMIYGAVLFAVILLNASIIGAASVTLSTSYAFGDVFGMRHSLHRSWREAKFFYASFTAMVAVAAGIVLLPHAPLGLITTGVQALAGVLLPSATVFLLLLCNDKAVLGPWVNGRWLNLFTGAVIAALVLLSIVLTASVLYPGMGRTAILAILGGGTALALAVAAGFLFFGRGKGAPIDRAAQADWRMPQVEELPPARLTPLTRIWMVVLRGYLLLAGGLVLFRIIQLATS